jgi:branched-chain amino acid transport system substrate-binding protein
MYLFEVKTPDQSEGEWDLYNQIATISGEDAFLPMLEECDFSKQ